MLTLTNIRTKLIGVVVMFLLQLCTYSENQSSAINFSFGQVWLPVGNFTETKETYSFSHYIFSSLYCLCTKRITFWNCPVGYGTSEEELPSIKSQDHLITCFCKVTWHINTLYLHYHNGYSYQTWLGGYIQWEASFHKVIESLDRMVFARRRDKINTLYHYYHNVYGYWTWQGGELL